VKVLVVKESTRCACIKANEISLRQKKKHSDVFGTSVEVSMEIKSYNQ